MKNDRLKFRVWSKKSKRYTGNNASYSIDDSGLLHVHTFGQHYELGNTEDFEVEQCTGLKDKNGNLIYENDVLSDGQKVGYVYWDNSGWACTSFLSKKLSELEIIGNIHEQKD